MSQESKHLIEPKSVLRDQMKAKRRSGNGRTSVGKTSAMGGSTSRNDLFPDLNLEHRKISDLKLPDRHVRACKAEHVKEIAEGIKYYGWCVPVLINSDGRVIDGAIRIKAAEVLDIDFVPCIIVDHLTPAQQRALRLALNRQQEKGTWDLEELKLELVELIDLEVSMEVIGFETAEIDLLIEDNFEIGNGPVADGSSGTEEDLYPSIDPDARVVSRRGDHWELGKHRLLCGSALDQSSFDLLMDGRQAAAVFTDPPYNVPIAGNVCGKGRVQHPEFVMASGELSAEEYNTFLTISLEQMAVSSVPGSVMFVCIDWRHIADLINVAKGLGLELLNICVWVKSNAGMGSLYRSQHELVAVLKVPGNTHTNNVQLGVYGRNRTNVWHYAGVNTLDPERRAELQMHPTVKPLDMVADAIMDVTRISDIVLDPFMGSGTTIMAAERTKRCCYGIELDPSYVDVTIRRWQSATGERAIHFETGLTFDQLAEKRAELVAEGSISEGSEAKANTQDHIEVMPDDIDDECGM